MIIRVRLEQEGISAARVRDLPPPPVEPQVVVDGILHILGQRPDLRKRDLFRRFALDNFAAIHRMVSNNDRVVTPIRDMYESLADRLGARIFEDRLWQLAEPTVKANFKKQVI